jgi:hypothetical protein
VLEWPAVIEEYLDAACPDAVAGMFFREVLQTVGSNASISGIMGIITCIAAEPFRWY